MNYTATIQPIGTPYYSPQIFAISLYVIALNLNGYLYKFFKWSKIKEMKGLPALTFLTTIGSFFEVGFQIMAFSNECDARVKCPLALGVIINFFDYIRTSTLGFAYTIRIIALFANKDAQKLLRCFGIFPVIYVIGPMLMIMDVFGVWPKADTAGQRGAAIMTFLFVANETLLHLLLLYVMNFGFLKEKMKHFLAEKIFLNKMIITNSCFYLVCTIIQGFATTFAEGKAMVSIVWNIDILSFLMVNDLLTRVMNTQVSDVEDNVGRYVPTNDSEMNRETSRKPKQQTPAPIQGTYALVSSKTSLNELSKNQSSSAVNPPASYTVQVSQFSDGPSQSQSNPFNNLSSLQSPNPQSNPFNYFNNLNSLGPQQFCAPPYQLSQQNALNEPVQQQESQGPTVPPQSKEKTNQENSINVQQNINDPISSTNNPDIKQIPANSNPTAPTSIPTNQASDLQENLNEADDVMNSMENFDKEIGNPALLSSYYTNTMPTGSLVNSYYQEAADTGRYEGGKDAEKK